MLKALNDFLVKRGCEDIQDDLESQFNITPKPKTSISGALRERYGNNAIISFGTMNGKYGSNFITVCIFQLVPDRRVISHCANGFSNSSLAVNWVCEFLGIKHPSDYQEYLTQASQLLNYVQTGNIASPKS